MENKIMTESLSEVLTYTKLRDIPKEDDGINVYIRAIAHVKKADNSENYAVIFKDKDGKDYAKKDFGHLSPIKQVIKIYPYDFLQARFLDVCKTNTKEERIQHIKSWNYKNNIRGKDYESMSIDELDDILVNIAIVRQYAAEKTMEESQKTIEDAAEKVARRRQILDEAEKALKNRTITIHEPLKRGRKKKEEK